jgi:hypothetical protein
MVLTPYNHLLKIWESSGTLTPKMGCRNPSLELTTKARGCKVASQEKDPGVTSHAPSSAKECEGMNLHTQMDS